MMATNAPASAGTDASDLPDFSGRSSGKINSAFMIFPWL